jgi:16S rRNA (adenine1518-N6/adenine1519-N6)-dimethyltransferase
LIDHLVYLMPVLARKRFGQHFLERAWAEKVARAIAPDAGDTFVEIGPGRGALTRPLVAAAARVVAFEIDRDLAAELRETPAPNLTIVEGDFLDTTADRLHSELLRAGVSPSAVRVAGNLPYNVASPILFKLIHLYDNGVPLTDATVMLQREVTDRLVAPPGTREYGVLSVLIRQRASVDRLLRLPPGAFRPTPQVQSSVVRLRFHPAEPAARDAGQFAALTRAVFTRRRKTLANALRAYTPANRMAADEALARAGIDGRRRPETLDIAEFVRLSDAYTQS